MTTIAELLLIERARMPLFLPVVLAFGILFGVYVPFTTCENFVLFILFSIILTISLSQHSKTASCFCFVFLLGIYIAQTGGIFKFNLLANKNFVSKEYDKISFNADVGFIEETHPTMHGMQRVVFQNIDIKNLKFIQTAKMTGSSKILKNIEPRQRVHVFGRILPYKTAAMPGAFDQRQYNSLIKMDATGIVFSIKKIGATKSNKFLDYFSYCRFFLTRSISKNISQPENGIAAALLTGDKSAIDPNIRNAFINSGTAHILAISGLHMSILSGILYIIFFRLFCYVNCFFSIVRPQICSSIATIFLSFLYLALSGFSPSAIRAFIMTTICFVSLSIGRGTISLQNVALAAFGILIFDPASLFLVSFQLSFSAVVALIAFYEEYKKDFADYMLKNRLWKKIMIYFGTSIITSLVASLATLPVSVSTFNRLSLSGILGNMIAIPITSLVIAPLGILSLAFGYFTNFFTRLFELSINFLILCIEHVAALPRSNLIVRSFDATSFFIVMFGLTLLCLLKTKLRHTGAAMIFLSLLVYAFEQSPNVLSPPQSETICFVENGAFFATSLQKSKNQVKSIQQHLGMSGKIIKKQFNSFNILKSAQGTFLWTKNGKILAKKQIAIRKHPYCPAYYKSLKID